MQTTCINKNTNEKWIFFSVTNRCGMLEVNILYFLGMFFSCGFAAPWLQAYYWREFFKRAYFGGRRVRFTGDGCGFFTIFIINYLLSIVTFGFWYLCGCASDRINTYMDEHLEWDDAGNITIVTHQTPPVFVQQQQPVYTPPQPAYNPQAY
eukprot:GEZU01012673.1.p1 GENE.GEZU01012673.1~~GEZU01012673.1.p1  ORF type:complete len:151 (-),score=54.67 GEZU01012673.1:101-553(-)